jgi:hypothetical protein
MEKTENGYIPKSNFLEEYMRYLFNFFQYLN